MTSSTMRKERRKTKKNPEHNLFADIVVEQLLGTVGSVPQSPRRNPLKFTLSIRIMDEYSCYGKKKKEQISGVGLYALDHFFFFFQTF